MKRAIRASQGTKTTLELMYKPYERYGGSGGLRKAKISGNDLLDALSKMVDKMALYFSSEDIEDEEMTAQDVLDRIESENGDGCDYIVSLKNLTTGEQLIEAYWEDEEDWDD